MKKYINRIISWFKGKIASYKFKKKIKLVKATFKSADSKITNQLIDNAAVDLLDTSNYNSTTAKRELIFKIAVDTIRKILPLRNIVGIKPMSGPVDIVKMLAVTTTGEDNRMSVEVISNIVAARSRRLRAALNMDDIHSLRNSSIRDEIIDAISTEVAAEIAEEMLRIIEANSFTIGHPDISAFEPDDHFITNIYKEANYIAGRSRRGIANVMITSPMIATVIMANSKDFTPAKDNPTISDMPYLRYAGSLGRLSMFVNPLIDDKVILGYVEQNNSEIIDAGFVFAPYKMVISAGEVADPRTLENTCRFITRFGTPENVAEISKYYTTISVKVV